LLRAARLIPAPRLISGLWFMRARLLGALWLMGALWLARKLGTRGPVR